jgi:hypothetical protein
MRRLSYKWRAPLQGAKSLPAEDYSDPFDAKAMIAFIAFVTLACLWFLFAASVYKLMGGVL